MFLQKDEVLSAEIIWGLKTVMAHYSSSSSADTDSLLQRMFPASKIAQQFKCRGLVGCKGCEEANTTDLYSSKKVRKKSGNFSAEPLWGPRQLRLGGKSSKFVLTLSQHMLVI